MYTARGNTYGLMPQYESDNSAGYDWSVLSVPYVTQAAFLINSPFLDYTVFYWMQHPGWALQTTFAELPTKWDFVKLGIGWWYLQHAMYI